MTSEPLPQLGRYRTVEVLGSGAMGVVYKAYDPGIDRYVALKTIRKELLSGPTGAMMVARFRNEAVAAGRLTHPGIVTVYEFGEDQSTAFIAMELAQGTDLSQYVAKRGGVSLDELKELMRQLLEALDYAHSQGVVHRDIKPANLLVSDAGRLKVTDFGIARLQDASLTMTGGMTGTPFYMSPEQFQGTGTDHRADLFAAGVILYELLTGAQPFQAATIHAVAYQVCHVEPAAPTQRNPHVPPEFDAIIAKALAKTKEARFSSGREFAAALGTPLTGGSALSNGTPPTQAGSPFPVPSPLISTGGSSTAPSRSARASLADGDERTDPSARTGPPMVAWNPALLSGLEAALAPFIGPIAKVMVKRAVAKAKDFDDLCARLGASLSTDAERAAFLKQATALRQKP